MGAYRSGADAQLDRAIAMHDALTGFLCQPTADIVPLDQSVTALERLLGHAG